MCTWEQRIIEDHLPAALDALERARKGCLDAVVESIDMSFEDTREIATLRADVERLRRALESVQRSISKVGFPELCDEIDQALSGNETPDA